VKIAKEILSGFWQGMGQLISIAVLGWLGTHISLLRSAAARLLLPGAAPQRVSLTIFLFVLSAALLTAWVVSQVQLWRLRYRIRTGKITLGDMMSRKRIVEAMDIEGAIRKRGM
jgi:hypothetical protein